VSEIPDNAFIGCTSLRSMVIPDGVTAIGAWAFQECSGLTSVVIPDSVTRIGMGAFIYCASLASVIVPDGVTEIDVNAFKGVPHIIYHGPACSKDNWGAQRMN